MPLQVVEAPRPVEAEMEAEPDYKTLDQPTTTRRKRAAAGGGGPIMAPADAGGEEYFDIPAFLRRQAD